MADLFVLRQSMSLGNLWVWTGLSVGNPWVKSLMDQSSWSAECKYPSWVPALFIIFMTYFDYCESGAPSKLAITGCHLYIRSTIFTKCISTVQWWITFPHLRLAMDLTRTHMANSYIYPPPPVLTVLVGELVWNFDRTVSIAGLRVMLLGHVASVHFNMRPWVSKCRMLSCWNG